MVGEAGVERRDEQGNIDGIVRAVGVDEDADRGFDVGDGEAQRGAFAETGVAHDAGAGLAGDAGGVIGGTAFDDDDVRGVVKTFADDGGDGGGFVARGDDGGDIGIGTGLGLTELIGREFALPDHAAGAEGHEAVLALTEAEDFGFAVSERWRGARFKRRGAAPSRGQNCGVRKGAERG